MPFCALDIETLTLDSRWLSGAVVSDTDRVYTEDQDAFIRCLFDHAKRGYTLIAHNAEYDLVNGLWSAGQDVSMHYHQGTFTCGYWHISKRGRSAQIWDLANLAGRLPLARIGEAIGLAKWPTPQLLQGQEVFQYRWFCDEHGAAECLPCYNLRDAEIVYRYATAFAGFLAAYGVEMKRTLAGNAVALWQLLDPGQQLTIRSEPVRELGRAAYHGGRCEPFKYGTVGPLYTYDRGSHYAAVMAECPMPDTRALLYLDGEPKGLDLERVEGVIEAEVYQPPTYLPVLPVVEGDSIYYPIGRFRGSWAICELRAALHRGARLLSIKRAAWSPRTLRPFRTYTGALFTLRQQYRDQNDPREAVVKGLLNGLYGRLGMDDQQVRRIYRRRLPGQPPEAREGARLEIAGDHVYLVKEHLIPKPSPTANIVWAANVTAWGRIRLLEQLEAAGKHLVYCDTDSLVTLAPMPSDADVPGGWRDTGTFTEGTFLSPKHYRMEASSGKQIFRAKGIPARVLEDYWREGSATYEHPLGVMEAIGRGLDPGKWVTVTRGRSLSIARRQLTRPGVLVSEPGWSETEPVVMGDSEPPPDADLLADQAAM